jgi:dienelactone hydrolase
MIEQTLDIATKDGAMESFICRPERGTHPAVLFLMDAPGIPEELRDMARRLATVSYVVLLRNLYYRAGRDKIAGGCWGQDEPVHFIFLPRSRPGPASESSSAADTNIRLGPLGGGRSVPLRNIAP